jgi:hypothetical protein
MNNSAGRSTPQGIMPVGCFPYGSYPWLVGGVAIPWGICLMETQFWTQTNFRVRGLSPNCSLKFVGS